MRSWIRYKKVIKEIPVSSLEVETQVHKLPEEVEGLIGIASGLKQEDIDSDERLSYFLNRCSCF